MASVATQEIRADSYVGFDSITNQIEHKLLKRGFQFNVIVVGACRTTRVATPRGDCIADDAAVLKVKLGWESLR